MARPKAPAEILLYTLPWCVHCARAKALLNRSGLPYQEIDGTAIPGFRRRLAELTGGITVPQIVIDGEPIGGADRLARLDRLGVLEAIANRQPFPITRELRGVSPGSVIGWAAARVRGRRDLSPARRVRVKLDRAGRVLATDPPDVQATKEEHDGEGMRRTAG